MVTAATGAVGTVVVATVVERNVDDVAVVVVAGGEPPVKAPPPPPLEIVDVVVVDVVDVDVVEVVDAAPRLSVTEADVELDTAAVPALPVTFPVTLYVPV